MNFLIKKVFGQKPVLVLTHGAKNAFWHVARKGIKSYADSVLPRVRRPVRLDRSRCVANPVDCLQCMHACPESVFVCGPVSFRDPAKTFVQYELAVGCASFCTLCGACVAACPNKALSLEA